MQQRGGSAARSGEATAQHGTTAQLQSSAAQQRGSQAQQRSNSAAAQRHQSQSAKDPLLPFLFTGWGSKSHPESFCILCDTLLTERLEFCHQAEVFGPKSIFPGVPTVFWLCSFSLSISRPQMMPALLDHDDDFPIFCRDDARAFDNLQ